MLLIIFFFSVENSVKNFYYDLSIITLRASVYMILLKKCLDRTFIRYLKIINSGSRCFNEIGMTL